MPVKVRIVEVAGRSDKTFVVLVMIRDVLPIRMGMIEAVGRDDKTFVVLGSIRRRVCQLG